MDEKEESNAEYYFRRTCGILHLNWMIDTYWTKVTREVILPSLVLMYDKLVQTKRTKRSKKTWWGDADGHLYYIPHSTKKIIVFTTQSQNFLFVFEPIEVRDYTPAKEGEDSGTFSEPYQTHTLHVRQFWNPYTKDTYHDFKRIRSSIKNVIGAVEILSEFSDDHEAYAYRPSLNAYAKVDYSFKFSKSNKFMGTFQDPGFILSYRPDQGKIENTKYAHVELENLATLHLPIMSRELRVKIPVLSGYENR